MTLPLYSFVYASSARTPFTNEDLETLLAEARERNRAHGVTGMLLYSGGNFLQALEGTQPALDTTMERIRASTRHGGLLTLYHEPIAQREFADWDMAFSRIQRSEFNRLNAGGAPARSLLRGFVERMR